MLIVFSVSFNIAWEPFADAEQQVRVYLDSVCRDFRAVSVDLDSIEPS